MTTRTAGQASWKSILLGAVGLLPLLAFPGCAPQYNGYRCGRVSCHYCPPRPLPWSTWESCNCTDSAGRAWAARLATGNQMEMAPEYRSDSNDFMTLPNGNSGSEVAIGHPEDN